MVHFSNTSGPDSSVIIATGYKLNGPGIESRCGARFSALVQTGPGALPSSSTMGTVSLLRVNSGPGCEADPSLPFSAVVKK